MEPRHTPAQSESPLSSYGKTVNGTNQLRFDPTIYNTILKEKTVVEDVVYTEANISAVKVSIGTHFQADTSVELDPFLASRLLRCVHRVVQFGIRTLRTAFQGQHIRPRLSRPNGGDRNAPSRHQQDRQWICGSARFTSFFPDNAAFWRRCCCCWCNTDDAIQSDASQTTSELIRLFGSWE